MIGIMPSVTASRAIMASKVDVSIPHTLYITHIADILFYHSVGYFVSYEARKSGIAEGESRLGQCRSDAMTLRPLRIRHENCT